MKLAVTKEGKEAANVSAHVDIEAKDGEGYRGRRNPLCAEIAAWPLQRKPGLRHLGGGPPLPADRTSL